MAVYNAETTLARADNEACTRICEALTIRVLRPTGAVADGPNPPPQTLAGSWVVPARLTAGLLARGARRMVIDFRNTRECHDRDARDKATIRAALGKRPSDSQMVYEHVLSIAEELLS